MRPEKPKLEVKHTRRDFLLKGASFFAKFAVANAGLYVVGSAFKSLDGSLVAGAKECYYDQAFYLSTFGCDTYQVGPFTSCDSVGPSPAGGCTYLNSDCYCYP
jgi:hypothetical protein